MADNDKRKFELPWGTLLPLLAVLAGVGAQYKPLVSTRPAVSSEKTIPVIAAQDVDARLWQGPFGVTPKQKRANWGSRCKKGRQRVSRHFGAGKSSYETSAAEGARSVARRNDRGRS